MKYRVQLFGLLLLVFCLGLSAQIGLSQDGDPVPTLVPPTLVPTPERAIVDNRLTESVIARIQQSGRVRVGTLLNDPPYSALNIRGEVAGFDADLARSIAEAWGVDLEFVQVTRQNAFDMLTNGHIDLLIASQTHRRDLDSRFEFSQTYAYGHQSAMVLNESGIERVNDLAFRTIGVVQGTASETAVNEWLRRENYPNVTVRAYLTIDQAYAALGRGEIDALIDNRGRLRSLMQPDVVRILPEPVITLPYAIVMLRQDVNLRNLVNRTLQYLITSGRIEELHSTYFPGEAFPANTMVTWQNIGDNAPTPGQYPTDVPYPGIYVLPEMLSSGVIRVAGFSDLPGDATESMRRTDTLNREIVQAMASRWGFRVEFIPNSRGNALDLVAAGEADLAVGVQPDWAWADRVDFTSPYLLHGERLMVPANSEIDSFLGLRGARWVAIANNEPEMRDRAVGWAESVNVRIEIYLTREQDIAASILDTTNANVAYGDSLKLIPHVQARPTEFRLTSRWYSRVYMGFAVPRNDLDFRLLVEYTLQELMSDGTIDRLLAPVMLPDEIPAFDIWPGSSEYAGLSLGTP